MSNKNEVLRVGLWGCGQRTNVIIKEAIKSEKIKISQCYDINKETARGQAERFGAHLANSEEELLNDKETDAFLICLYPGLHAAALKKAVPMGKPIYIEKPVATNWNDYNDLLEVERKYDTLVQVGLMHRYCSVFKTITDLVHDGKVGRRLVGITINWLRVLGGDFKRITAMNNHIINPDITIEDNWDILLQYKNGGQVNFHSSMRNSRNTEMGF